MNPATYRVGYVLIHNAIAYVCDIVKNARVKNEQFLVTFIGRNPLLQRFCSL
jgi:hypothetical protein